MTEPRFRGWTPSQLRQALPNTGPKAQAILSYIARHPGATGREIAEALGLNSDRSVGAPLRSQFTPAGEALGVADVRGEFHWPLDMPKGRDGISTYTLPPDFAKVVHDVLGS